MEGLEACRKSERNGEDLVGSPKRWGEEEPPRKEEIVSTREARGQTLGELCGS